MLTPYRRLLAAIEAHDLDEFYQVLDSGVISESSDNFTICLATAHGQFEMVNRLLQPDCIIPGTAPYNDKNFIFAINISSNPASTMERLLEPDCIELGITTQIWD